MDLAMQYAGDAEAALAMSVQNDKPITDEIDAGTQMPYPDVVNDDVALLFLVEKIKPSSVIIDSEASNEGIDYWQLENDFVIQ